MQLTNLLDKKFIGADDLRKDLSDIIEKLNLGSTEIVVTQHGKPKVVLIDIETYLRFQELEDELADYDPKLIKRLNKALADVKKNGGIPAEQVWKELGI